MYLCFFAAAELNQVTTISGGLMMSVPSEVLTSVFLWGINFKSNMHMIGYIMGSVIQLTCAFSWIVIQGLIENRKIKEKKDDNNAMAT